MEPNRTGDLRRILNLLSSVDTDAGRQRVADYLKTQPFPHFKAAPGRPGVLIRIDADGTRTFGRFVGREFQILPYSFKEEIPQNEIMTISPDKATASSRNHLTVQVQVTREFHAAAELVFDAWLDPAMIGQWMFGPKLREEEIVWLETDPRVGGRFSFVVRRGEHELDHIGTYFELERPRRLAFSWAVRGHSEEKDSRVTIDITPNPAGCTLTLTHQMHSDWAEYAQRTEAGWTKMIGALGTLLEGE
jgi:uncharacterized protein YndB with AHSA1/START domain